MLHMDHGQPVTARMFGGRFDAARMRDLRAKAATEKEASTGCTRDASNQLVHSTAGMTKRYIRRRKGLKVMPARHKIRATIPRRSILPKARQTFKRYSLQHALTADIEHWCSATSAVPCWQ